LVRVLFVFQCVLLIQYLLSFPTRRSSDLERVAPRPDGSGLALGMARAYTGGFRSGLGHYDEAIALLTSGTELLREHVNGRVLGLDRKSTRLNSSHVKISYAVFCLKKKNKV